MASTVLSKTFTASNRKTFTISTWIKRTGLGSNHGILGSGTNSSTDRDSLYFESNDYLYFDAKVSSSVIALFQTNRKFRDVGAFYHIVLAFDTTQNTDTDRMKLYVNGELETFSSVTYPAKDTNMNTNNTAHTIGAILGPVYYFDGLMSYFAFTDGTAYTPTSFGETDSSSGIWKWKSPSVTYGTNGFFLKMDTSSPGTDTSGNSNTFTASGTPTLTQDNASNNLSTLNSVYKNFNQPTFSNGNTTTSSSSSGYLNAFSTIANSTGKWYAEIKRGSSESQIGISSLNDAATLFNVTDYYLGETAKSLGISNADGKYRIGTTATTYGSSYTTGDIIGLALDLTNKKLYASKNGAWANGSGAWSSTTFDAAVGAIDISAVIPSGEYAYIGFSIGAPGTGFNANFGNGFFGVTPVASSNADAAGHGLFEYAVPTGFFTLNTKNLNTYG